MTHIKYTLLEKINKTKAKASVGEWISL